MAVPIIDDRHSLEEERFILAPCLRGFGWSLGSLCLGRTWEHMAQEVFSLILQGQEAESKTGRGWVSYPQGPYSNNLSFQHPITSKIEPSQRARKELWGANPYLTWRPQFSKDYSQCGISRTRPWPHFLMGH